MVAVAIREEASPEIERDVDEVTWVGLGQLGRCIDALRQGGVREAVMAGQVKHRQIFSDVVPDLKLMGLLARLAFKNTDSLIGAVADALEREGIVLLPSTALLGDQMATRRCHDPAPAGQGRAQERRVRRPHRAPARRARPGPDRGGQGPRRRRPGGDGGNGRDDPAGRPHRRARARAS